MVVFEVALGTALAAAPPVALIDSNLDVLRNDARVERIRLPNQLTLGNPRERCSHFGNVLRVLDVIASASA
jgi:hypothetical protein